MRLTAYVFLFSSVLFADVGRILENFVCNLVGGIVELSDCLQFYGHKLILHCAVKQ